MKSILIGAALVAAIAPQVVVAAGKPLDVFRPGDKSLENVIRTDERYGDDGLFFGPRGWGYWNFLENPRPIQNPNLWPDMQSTYFIGQFSMPAGSSLTLRGEFPRARYFKFALYKSQNNTFVSIGQDLGGPDIVPDPGSTNPFKVGADRLGDARSYTLHIVAEDAPSDASRRVENTLYVGKEGGTLQSVIRIYLPDEGSDGAGWAPATSPSATTGFPRYEATLADGTRLNHDGVVKQLGRPMEGNTAQPFTTDQWIALVDNKNNDPTLDPATAPARKDGRWQKYWNIKYSIVGSFKTPSRAGEDSLCWTDRRRRGPGHQLPFRAALPEVRAGLCRDRGKMPSLSRHLCRCRRQGP